VNILSLHIVSDLDIISVRQQTRHVAQGCGFKSQDIVGIVCSVTEAAYAAFKRGKKSEIDFSIDLSTQPPSLVVQASGVEPSTVNANEFLAGLPGARSLMDEVCVKAEAGAGTKIKIRKNLPSSVSSLTNRTVRAMPVQLANGLNANDVTAELMQQNQELAGTLMELKARQEDLIQLTEELDDTNSGVVALYAELDEKAKFLQRADAQKSRFLSNMSHEFRTPLSSIRALANLLLQHMDGDLTEEQDKQVNLIMDSAINMTEMVNDLLDLAKIESGKVDVMCSRFDVVSLFSGLRSALGPLVENDKVDLNFIPPNELIPLFTDQTKLTQILRNFISNAIKYTDCGKIDVYSSKSIEDQSVTFYVSDTGVGLDMKYSELIFEEFSQIENPLQSKAKGTGLGLPLCKNLATLLGGSVAVESEVGRGSVFSVTIPLR